MSKGSENTVPPSRTSDFRLMTSDSSSSARQTPICRYKTSHNPGEQNFFPLFSKSPFKSDAAIFEMCYTMGTWSGEGLRRSDLDGKRAVRIGPGWFRVRGRKGLPREPAGRNGRDLPSGAGERAGTVQGRAERRQPHPWFQGPDP